MSTPSTCDLKSTVLSVLPSPLTQECSSGDQIPSTFSMRLLLLLSCKPMAVCASCRIPAGGTAKAEFSVTPLDIGSGTALGAIVTYKRQEGASEIQVGSCSYPFGL